MLHKFLGDIKSTSSPAADSPDLTSLINTNSNPTPKRILKVKRRKKNITREELEVLTKDELLDMVMKLETHNEQLKFIILNNSGSFIDKEKKKRNFDFAKCPKRFIMLKFCYLGWDFKGYALQDNVGMTIEHHLFDALQKSFLIESRQTSTYNNCGRTDKGVSAFEQVISIEVRSKVIPDQQLSRIGIASELKYCELLNRILPSQIRAIAWRPFVTPTYSARFDCTDRTYKYFFPRGDLNVEKMREGCQLFVGTHDIRNICKMDVRNGVINYIRRIDSMDIKVTTKNHEELEPFDMLCLEIRGLSFARHMVRCIAAILMLIGHGKEELSLITELLDVEKNPRRPEYAFAEQIPLVLFNTNFRDDEPPDTRDTEMLNQWIYNEAELKGNIIKLQRHWCESSVKSSMLYEMVKSLQHEYSSRFPNQPEIKQQMASLNRSNNQNTHKKFLERQMCPTLEEKIEHYKQRNRFEDD